MCGRVTVGILMGPEVRWEPGSWVGKFFHGETGETSATLLVTSALLVVTRSY